MTDALQEKQIQLEYLFNKNQTISRIKKEIASCTEFDFTAYMTAKGIPVDFGYDLMVQMVLHKRAKLDVLVGLLKKHFEPARDACQQTVDMIIQCAQADLVDYSAALDIFIVTANITQDVQDELDRFQYPLPMVVAPKPLTKNTSTPYLSLKDGSVILRNNHHNDDVCLDHLNRMNRVKLMVNGDTAKKVSSEWRNLDKPKPGETKQDFEKRRRAFDKYDRTAKDVIELLTELGNCFYLTHKVDKRGRTYCQGYHCTYQGASWNKAVIELAPEHHEIIE